MNNELFFLLKNKKFKQLEKLITDNKNNPLLDLNIKDEGNVFLINYGILFNNATIVKFMLLNGARIDVIDEYGRSILFLPIKHNYIKLAKMLLKLNQQIAVGLNILDIIDINGNTPLFYSFIYKNIEFAKEIIDRYDVEYQNKKGLAIIHYATLTNSIEALQFLLNVRKINVNNQIRGSGETVLHLAVYMNLEQIVDLLLTNKKGFKLDIDVQDYDNQMTPLHYAITKNQKYIKILLANGANVNIQDKNGNTCMHYIIEREMHDILNSINYTHINCNILNREHNTLLHKFIFYNLMFSHESMFNYLIQHTNLNIQNINGETPLHLLIKNDQEFILKLQNNFGNLKINLFIANKNGDTLYDLLTSETNKNALLQIAANHFYNKLTQYTQEQKNNWLKIVNEFDQNDTKQIVDEIDKKHNKSNNSNVETNTETNIKTNIVNMIKHKLIHKSFKINHKSYPYQSKHIDIIIDTKKQQFCDIIGSTLDVLIGNLYLLQHYRSNYLLTMPLAFSKNIKTNDDVIHEYNKNGIEINVDFEFFNFQIFWINNNIVFPLQFRDLISKCIKTESQFIVIPLLINKNGIGHYNSIIIDNNTKTIERFEPNGYCVSEEYNYNGELLDNIIKNELLTQFVDYKYIKPCDYLPFHGFQQFDNLYRDDVIGDPHGFCFIWTVYYIELRMMNPNRKLSKIINSLLRIIKTLDVSFKSVIRNYGMNITNLRNKIMNKFDVSINDWNNHTISHNKLLSIVDDLTTKIQNE